MRVRNFKSITSCCSMRRKPRSKIQPRRSDREWKALAPHCELSVPLVVKTGWAKYWDEGALDCRPSPQQKPEDKSVRHEKRWHQDSGYEERGAQRANADPDADLSLVERVQQINRAPQIEYPDDGECPGNASRES